MLRDVGAPERPSALLPVYAEFPIRPVRGRGSWLIDEDGLEWLDAYGGHAVAATGHSHPDVVRAIAEQAGELLFYSTAVRHPLRIALAERLAASCPAPLERVFFCNSGAEANENALHLARKHTGRRTIVSVTGRVARPHRGHPRRDRRRPLRGGRPPERDPAQSQGAARRRGRDGRGGGRVGRRGDRGAGAGARRRARLSPSSSSGPPAAPATRTARC